MNVIILVKTRLPYWHGQSPDRCPSLPAVLCHIRLDRDLDVGDFGAKERVCAKKMNISKLSRTCSCPSCVFSRWADVEIELFIEKPVKANPELFGNQGEALKK